MVQPHSWTDEVVGLMEKAGMTVSPEAATALEAIISRGQTRLNEEARRQLTEPDLRQHVDTLATRLIGKARENGVDTLTGDTIKKLFGWLCPGFFPWC